jgi:penicillin amidase
MPYHADVGPSMRQIVDLATPYKSWTVIPGGQSGQRFSDHYKDQIEMWRNGSYREASMKKAQIERTAAQHAVLVPKKE